MRTTRRLLTVLVLAAAAATGGYFVARSEPAKSVAAPVVLKTAAVTAGDLTTTEKIDGTLELSDSLAVLHRIEGQTSSADTSTPAASTAAASPTAGPTGSIGSSASGFAAVATAGKIAAAITDLVATAPPSDPTSPSTTSTTPATTTVATDPGAPPSSVDETTTSLPDDTSTTATTGPTGPTDTTVPGGRTGGGSGGFGGGSRTGSTGSGGGSSTTGASTTRVTQTVTSVIGVGTSVGLGDVLYTVDSQPVVALSGALPAWRSLSTSSDDGPDVQQLESSLVSLGYDPDGTVTVDNAYDSHTKAMVKRWQTGLGVEATGTVALGSVVFIPTTTKVSSVTAAIGDAVGDGDTIVTLTADTQDVVIDVPDGDETFIVPGLSVQLGDGTGTVSLLRSVERDSAVVVQAVIAPAAPIDGANGATVKVTITTDNVDGVLIAPADALLSRIDGTYAVQVQGTDGTVTWQTVDLLGVSGNKVGIRGDGVAAGTLVLVPI